MYLDSRQSLKTYLCIVDPPYCYLYSATLIAFMPFVVTLLPRQNAADSVVLKHNIAMPMSNVRSGCQMSK